MNRNEFMTRLEALLADISSEEREEALQYYHDYFEDAGAENEADVIRELGSPQRVAATIKADLKYDNGGEAGEFTERGYRDERFERKETPAQRTDSSRYENGTFDQDNTNTYGYAGDQTTQESPRTSTGLKIALIILIVLVGAPIVIPIAFGVVCMVLGFMIAAFAFFAGLVIGAIGVMIAGVVIIIAGITLLATAVPSAMLAMGTGLLTFVVGLIGTVVTVKLCMVMYPAMCRILVNICRKPFHRGKAVA
ncbi:DUF1700 domain-containing protein [Mediterraneibacter agrestimuris]|uniref:DUF1700 domain-containing protein n=1 Tax=Mediterraneibacter agrestimuris TaxID=2941333 RepID=UPI00203E3081|nr:DUF1700 domain-containing protein [Mediterraneibacter agrestimuris]